MIIFILGYMGAGKTKTGRKLANVLEYDFIDLDALIEEEVGLSIPEYFKKYGETAFREEEQAILKHTFFKENTVVSLGGGTPSYQNNMALINSSGVSVYLDPPIGMIWSRIAKNIERRPVIQAMNEPKALEFEKLYVLRQRDYLKAHLHYSDAPSLITNVRALIRAE